MEAVIAGLTDDIENDKYGTGQSNGQSGYVNGIEGFVLIDAAYRNSNEIFPHNFFKLISIDYS
jgi:hypothetical protein